MFVYQIASNTLLDLVSLAIICQRNEHRHVRQIVDR